MTTDSRIGIALDIDRHALPSMQEKTAQRLDQAFGETGA